jgi:hypothetical protein
VKNVMYMRYYWVLYEIFYRIYKACCLWIVVRLCCVFVEGFLLAWCFSSGSGNIQYVVYHVPVLVLVHYNKSKSMCKCAFTNRSDHQPVPHTT